MSEDAQAITLWRWVDSRGENTSGWHAGAPHEYGDHETREFVPLSAFRLVEEELRQAREVAHSRLRDRARLVRRAERAEADLDLLTRRFALVASRSGVRAQALQLAEECITENVANGEGVDSQSAVLDAIFDALKYEIADEPDGARPGAEPPIQSTPVSPVQGEHHAQPEGESQMDDNDLNHLIGERDAMKWVDGFLTVVPDADRDLMHTWFACAIESGRMTVQGEHEQDGETFPDGSPLPDCSAALGELGFGDSGKAAGVRVEYQAVGIDGEALLPRDESGPIITYRGAKEEAAAMCDLSEPPYDEVFIERRTVTETAWERFAGCGEIVRNDDSEATR